MVVTDKDREYFAKAAAPRTPTVPGDPLLTELLADYTQRHAAHLRSPDTARHHANRIGRWVEGRRASEARSVAAAITPMEVVREIWGHTSVKTTERYAHVMAQPQREALAKLGDLHRDLHRKQKRRP